MHLLYTDETNYDSTGNDFFIYGGVAINAEKAAELNKSIDDLRLKYGYQPLDPLKLTRGNVLLIFRQITTERLKKK